MPPENTGISRSPSNSEKALVTNLFQHLKVCKTSRPAFFKVGRLVHVSGDDGTSGIGCVRSGFSRKLCFWLSLSQQNKIHFNIHRKILIKRIFAFVEHCFRLIKADILNAQIVKHRIQ